MGVLIGENLRFNGRVPLWPAWLAGISATTQALLPPADAPSDRLSACKLTRGPQRSHQTRAAPDGGASDA